MLSYIQGESKQTPIQCTYAVKQTWANLMTARRALTPLLTRKLYVSVNSVYSCFCIHGTTCRTYDCSDGQGLYSSVWGTTRMHSVSRWTPSVVRNLWMLSSSMPEIHNTRQSQHLTSTGSKLCWLVRISTHENRQLRLAVTETASGLQCSPPTIHKSLVMRTSLRMLLLLPLLLLLLLPLPLLLLLLYYYYLHCSGCPIRWHHSAAVSWVCLYLPGTDYSWWHWHWHCAVFSTECHHSLHGINYYYYYYYYDSLEVSVLDFRSRDPGSSSVAAGGRIATVGQLLFAPWAWVYSTLHP